MTALPIGSLPDGATSEIVWVGPDEALEWLENTNTHNRAVSQTEVDKLAGAITRGEWKLNGDAIRFDGNGVLLDGQHRLWAIVQSETPVQTLVVRGLDPESQHTMDVGRRRSLYDTLKINGHKATKQLTAATSILFKIEQGTPMGNRGPTIDQGLDVIRRNPGLEVAAQRADGWRQHVGIPGSVLAVVYHLAVDVDADDANVFFERLASGADLAESDPIFVLRRWAHRQSTTRARSPQYMYLAMTIKAWNAWRQGRKIQTLVFRPGGATPEEFPGLI